MEDVGNDAWRSNICINCLNVATLQRRRRRICNMYIYVCVCMCVSFETLKWKKVSAGKYVGGSMILELQRDPERVTSFGGYSRAFAHVRAYVSRWNMSRFVTFNIRSLHYTTIGVLSSLSRPRRIIAAPVRAPLPRSPESERALIDKRSRLSALLLPSLVAVVGRARPDDGNQNEVVKEFYTLMLEASRRRESLACSFVPSELKSANESKRNQKKKKKNEEQKRNNGELTDSVVSRRTTRRRRFAKPFDPLPSPGRVPWQCEIL